MIVLIIGARENSLGAYIASIAGDETPHVLTAGVSGEEDYHLDINDRDEILDVLEQVRPTHIVCTAGVNRQRAEATNFEWWMASSFAINCIGPMAVLDAWLNNFAMKPSSSVAGKDGLQHFVAISSNSAHIARRNSMAYCASKAALSMSLRVAARDLAGTTMLVYGYEFGLLADTPMTTEVRGRLGGQPAHRMPGVGAGIDPSVAALAVVNGLAHGGRELNGCLLRLDAGEQ